MTTDILAAQKTYAREGFVLVRSLIAHDEATSLFNEYLRVVRGEIYVPTWSEFLGAKRSAEQTAKLEPRGEHHFMQSANPSGSPDLRHWRAHPCYTRAAALARSLCPIESLSFSYDQCFYKPGGATALVYPHQDAAYWKAVGITCWMALTPVAQNMAPVEYYPNSHERLLPHIDAPKAWNGVRDFTVAPESLRALTSPVSFMLEPGDCVFHSSLLVHGSGPNRSAKARCGLALHFKTKVRLS